MVEHMPSGGSMRRRVEHARKWASTTPGRLRVLSIEIAVVVAALMAIGSGTAITALVTVNGIQQRTVPMIVGMQHVHAWLSDADRSAATTYLAGGFDSTVTQLQFEAEATATGLDVLGRLNPDDPQVRYEADIAATNRQLQFATEQTQEGDEANQRLHALAVAVANYTRLIETAAATEATDPTAGMVYLQGGSNLMHGLGGILVQVDTLGSLFAGDLQRANVTLEVTAGMIALFAGVALWLLVLLVRTQRFLTARFRRRRNGRLVAATLLLVVVGMGCGAGAVEAAQSLRTAENESLVEVMSLWDTRTLVYDASGNASMALIARGGGAAFEQSFRNETSQLVDRPLTNDLLRAAEQGQVRFNGLLADDLRNAETPAERESALHTLRSYQAFMQADSSAQQQADAAARAEADAAAARAAQARSSRPGPSPSPSASPAANGAAGAQPAPARPPSDRPLVSAVDELDWYLGASLQMRQNRLDGGMSDASFMLVVTLVLVTLAIGVAGLTFWGVQPRIEEYAQ
jgi:hypothetical protein